MSLAPGLCVLLRATGGLRSSPSFENAAIQSHRALVGWHRSPSFAGLRQFWYLIAENSVAPPWILALERVREQGYRVLTASRQRGRQLRRRSPRPESGGDWLSNKKPPPPVSKWNAERKYARSKAKGLVPTLQVSATTTTAAAERRNTRLVSKPLKPEIRPAIEEAREGGRNTLPLRPRLGVHVNAQTAQGRGSSGDTSGARPLGEEARDDAFWSPQPLR
ncbi:hypothetical protein BDY21DRAFT_360400 [Lineolata rhizophorae]|uniref:Uncharacterized protein n=1 Tax=Lineolata rhizophorae TaxID=578093 RepID=A0A6A6PBR8_9PEZI|nr:hypothetical protein BDY21DRAFT_360400 [Lineolata rhizophorae]